MNKFKILATLLITLAIASCGGGSGGTITGTGGGVGGGGEVDCDVTPEDPSCTQGGIDVLMGSGLGVDFVDQAIEIGLASLSAGGSTLLEVTLVRQDDPAILYTATIVDVTFDSPCVQQGLAAIDPITVSTNTGRAQATYTATGCTGDDVVSASATVGTALSASGVVTVASAGVNAINFVSADPDTIGLQGTGGLGFDETSEVTFRVVDSVGLPVAGADVSFSLDSNVGGISLSPDTDTSDQNGLVQTVVTAGTVAGTVRVSAVVDNTLPAVGTQSSGLVVSTGLPDQDSFSWAVTCPNVEAWNYDGVQADITVRLRDRFNNPVPDGTSVSFNTEGGGVEPSCITTSSETEQGFCVATWTSSAPRPADGRVTVLAHAIGEETFTDFNGNGVFDPADSWDDIPEIYRDDDESGNFLAGTDGFFLDFNSNNVYDAADGEFNGILCQDPPRCEGTDITGIGASGVIIMSGSSAVISDNVGGFLDLGSGSGAVTFTIGDARGQPMPAGTTVTLESQNGEILGEDTLATPCTSNDGPLPFTFVLNGDDEPDVSAALLTVTTPGPGVGTAEGVATVYFITVSDIPPP